MSKDTGREATRFIVVGTAGFLADAAVLFALIHGAGMGPVLARAFSFPPAFALTWVLNRNWTFLDGRKRRPANQLALYLWVQLTGFAINYGIYTLLVLSGIFWFDRPYLALAAGSMVALFATFTLSKVIAFAAPGQGR